MSADWCLQCQLSSCLISSPASGLAWVKEKTRVQLYAHKLYVAMATAGVLREEFATVAVEMGLTRQGEGTHVHSPPTALTAGLRGLSLWTHEPASLAHT
jgi:hypothetical protein